MNAKRQNLIDNIRLTSIKCITCGTLYPTLESSTPCPTCGANDGVYTTPQDKKLIDSLVEKYIKLLETVKAKIETEIAILNDKTDYPEAFIRPRDGLMFVLNKNNKYSIYPRTKLTDEYEYSYEGMVNSNFYQIRKEMLEVI
jgi:predicted  nucleic acid-binding Zn-ribbon protein